MNFNTTVALGSINDGAKKYSYVPVLKVKYEGYVGVASLIIIIGFASGSIAVPTGILYDIVYPTVTERSVGMTAVKYGSSFLTFTLNVIDEVIASSNRLKFTGIVPLPTLKSGAMAYEKSP